ncbi:hypothetical protein MJO28_005872 [Puccinia striiformis f. sp. tritici]|uniref:Uncharacterized protein n=1 Tax=Puccinia striiformis f. sp. tritici TaxID=168172 RepID=A0ACC0EG90_9BASI|nr:hypothetical protein MJO28_005872 [Puccinia striiformis f. sp. tritici]
MRLARTYDVPVKTRSGWPTTNVNNKGFIDQCRRGHSLEENANPCNPGFSGERTIIDFSIHVCAGVPSTSDHDSTRLDHQTNIWCYATVSLHSSYSKSLSGSRLMTLSNISKNQDSYQLAPA